MQVRIGASVFDLQRRPLVIAHLHRAGNVHVVTDLATAAKEATGRGADLIVLPAGQVTAAALETLDEVGAGGVVVATRGADLDSPATQRVAAILWAGPEPLPVLDRDDADQPWVISATPDGLRAGDGVLVAHDRLDDLARVPEGIFGLVDLTPVGDRAALAALVTVALELGAQGFVTTVPSAVRRAAHVIRAVEHAE